MPRSIIASAELVQLVEASALLARQELHPLGHAIGAAQVAAVRHRQAQIGDPPVEGVDQRLARALLTATYLARNSAD